MSLEAWGDSDEEMRAPDGYVTEEFCDEMVREITAERDALLADLRKCEQQLISSYELAEQAALICDQEANRQSAFSNDAKEHGVKLAHSTAAWACMELAKRIRALCPLTGA